MIIKERKVFCIANKPGRNYIGEMDAKIKSWKPIEMKIRLLICSLIGHKTTNPWLLTGENIQAINQEKIIGIEELQCHRCGRAVKTRITQAIICKKEGYTKFISI